MMDDSKIGPDALVAAGSVVLSLGATSMGVPSMMTTWMSLRQQWPPQQAMSCLSLAPWLHVVPHFRVPLQLQAAHQSEVALQGSQWALWC
jgi:hypothetical protein